MKPIKPVKWRKSTRPFFQEMVTIFPVFSNFKLTVIFTEELSKTAAYISDRDFISEPSAMDDVEAFTASNWRKGYSYIYLQPDAPTGTVAHEAYHAVCNIMRMAGAEEEHEVMAYHLGYVVDLISAFQLKVKGRFKGEKK